MPSIIRDEGDPSSLACLYPSPALPIGWGIKVIPGGSDVVFVHVPTGYVQKANPCESRPTTALLQQAIAQNARTTVGNGAESQSRMSLETDEHLNAQQCPLAPPSCSSELATGLLADLHLSTALGRPVCRPQRDIWGDLTKWHNARYAEQREALLDSHFPLQYAMDDFRNYTACNQGRAGVSILIRRWFEAQTEEHRARIRREVEDMLSNLPPHQSMNSVSDSLIRPTSASLRQGRANQLAAYGSAVFQDQNAFDRIEVRMPLLERQASDSSRQGLILWRSATSGSSQQSTVVPSPVSSMAEEGNVDVEVRHHDAYQETSSDPNRLSQSTLVDTAFTEVIDTRRAQDATLALNRIMNGVQGQQTDAPPQPSYHSSSTQQTLPATNVSNENAESTNSIVPALNGAKDDPTPNETALRTNSEPNLGLALPMGQTLPGRPLTALASSSNQPPGCPPPSLLPQATQTQGTPDRSGTTQGQNPSSRIPQDLQTQGQNPSSRIPQDLQTQNKPQRSDVPQRRDASSLLPPHLRGWNRSHSQSSSHTQSKHRPFHYDPEGAARYFQGIKIEINGRDHICGTPFGEPSTASERPRETIARPHTNHGRLDVRSLAYHQSSTTIGGNMRARPDPSNSTRVQQELSYSQPSTNQNKQIEETDDTTEAATRESTPSPRAPRVRLPPASYSQALSSHNPTHGTQASMGQSTVSGSASDFPHLQPSGTTVGVTMATPAPSNPSAQHQGGSTFAQIMSQPPSQQVQGQIQIHGQMQVNAQNRSQAPAQRRGLGVPGAPTGPRFNFPQHRNHRRN